MTAANNWKDGRMIPANAARGNAEEDMLISINYSTPYSPGGQCASVLVISFLESTLSIAALLSRRSG